MRRRRLLPVPAGPGEVATASTAIARGDLGWLEHVVVGRFPVRSARAYLHRCLGHDVRVRLVEAERGEKLGIVRAIEVEHAGGGGRTRIDGERRLPTGEPASWSVPDQRVRTTARVVGPAVRTGGLQPGDVVVLLVPVRSYARFLPEVLRTGGAASRPISPPTAFVPTRTEPAGSDPEDALRRFLFVFQHLMTTVTDRIDRLSSLTDPASCAPELLPWVASWVDFDLDASLPVDQQRELVARAIRLYRTRGTRDGIEEMIRVLTSAPARVSELSPPRGLVLGRAALSGGGDVTGRYARGEDVGCFLVPEHRPRARSFELRLEPRSAFRARFGERAPDVLRRIADVVSRERPAHVTFTIRFEAEGSDVL